MSHHSFRERFLTDAADRLVARHQPQHRVRSVVNQIDPNPGDSDLAERRARDETASVAAEISRRLDQRRDGTG